MFEDLKIIYYPDPRLKRMSARVEQFDDRLKALAQRMLQLMRESRGVGLAAPQVGENLRLFVMNHSGNPDDDRVYANPILSEAEEGCLSLPEVNVRIVRDKTIRIDAKDLEGQPFSQTATGYLARIWQHEIDHLNGILLTDRMGPVQKMINRKVLRELEEDYAKAHAKKK